MNKKIISLMILMILLTFFATIVVFFVINKNKKTFPLVSPASPVPSVVPLAPSYNPPKEIHYSGSTNLKEELDSINPEVLESDFE